MWDCSGREGVLLQNRPLQEAGFFRNVKVLIYVFDMEGRDLQREIYYYQMTLEALSHVRITSYYY